MFKLGVDFLLEKKAIDALLSNQSFNEGHVIAEQKLIVFLRITLNLAVTVMYQLIFRSHQIGLF